MNRQFLVPATIAAAVHAGLLFGLGRGHPALPAGIEKPATTLYEFLLAPESPPPDLTPTSGGPAAGTPRPTLGDPPPVDTPTPFPVPYTPTAALLPDIRADMIPSGPVGLPGPVVDKPGVGPGGILGQGDLDNTPRTKLSVSPLYPYEARNAGLDGEVLVEFVVDETGAVTSPRVVRSSSRLFEEPALRAVAKWKFEPGRRLGRVVRFRMALPIVFSLNHD